MMTDHTERGSEEQSDPRIEAAEAAPPMPSQAGRSGGTLQRDIATQAEEEHLVDGKTGITRVRGEDKRDD